MRKIIIIFLLATSGSSIFCMELLEKRQEEPITREEAQKQLFEAVKEDNQELAKRALAHGADSNACDDRGYEPMHTAAWNNSVNMLELLATHGANLNARDNTGNEPMHAAAANGQVNVLEWLVAHGANINVYDKNGIYPLHWAIKRGQLNAILWFIEHGIPLASLTAIDRDKFEKYKLIHVVLKGEEEETRELLEKWGTSAEEE